MKFQSKQCTHLCPECMHHCKCQAVVLRCYRFIPAARVRSGRRRRLGLQKERL